MAYPSDGAVVSTASISSYDDRVPSCLVEEDSNGNVYVLSGRTASTSNALLRKWNGSSWSTIRTITSLNSSQQPVRMCLDANDVIHIAWSDSGDDGYYDKSTDGGSNWLASPESVFTGSIDQCIGIGCNTSGEVWAVYGTTAVVSAVYKRTTGGSWSSQSFPSSTYKWATVTQCVGYNKIYVAGENGVASGNINYFVIDTSDSSISASVVSGPARVANTMDGATYIVEDKNGDLHCVFGEKNPSYFKHVYYSNNIGGSWSTGTLLWDAGAANNHWHGYLTINDADEVHIWKSAWKYSTTVETRVSSLTRLAADSTDWDSATVERTSQASTSYAVSPVYRGGSGTWAVVYNGPSTQTEFHSNSASFGARGGGVAGATIPPYTMHNINHNS